MVGSGCVVIKCGGEREGEVDGGIREKGVLWC